MTGQLKLLDLPIIRGKIEDEHYKKLVDVTRAKLSGFTKTTNDKQRAKDRRVEQPENEIDDTGAQLNLELPPSQFPMRTGGSVEEQSSLNQNLQTRIQKYEGLVSALKIILDLVD